MKVCCSIPDIYLLAYGLSHFWYLKDIQIILVRIHCVNEIANKWIRHYIHFTPNVASYLRTTSVNRKCIKGCFLLTTASYWLYVIQWFPDAVPSGFYTTYLSTDHYLSKAHFTIITSTSCLQLHRS